MAKVPKRNVPKMVERNPPRKNFLNIYLPKPVTGGRIKSEDIMDEVIKTNILTADEFGEILKYNCEENVMVYHLKSGFIKYASINGTYKRLEWFERFRGNNTVFHNNMTNHYVCYDKNFNTVCFIEKRIDSGVWHVNKFISDELMELIGSFSDLNSAKMYVVENFN